MKPGLCRLWGVISFLLPSAQAAIPPPVETSFYQGTTEFGDPDLQGIWTNKSLSQVQPQFDPGRAEFTEEEAAFRERRYRQSKEGPRPQKIITLKPTQLSGEQHRFFGYDSVWSDFGESFARLHGKIRNSWIYDPPDGNVPYNLETLEFVRREIRNNGLKFDNPEDRWADDRCLVGYGSTGGPPMLNVFYNNTYQIAQSPGYVMIVVEMNHDVRIIRLGGQHLPPQIRPWLGDSVGHWEGTTLVVETTQIHPLQAFSKSTYRDKLYVSPGSRVTEWFTRVSKDEIHYRFEVTDPAAYTQPWSGEVLMRATPGPLFEYACHEGNQSLRNILAGARYQERHGTGPHAKPGATRREK